MMLKRMGERIGRWLLRGKIERVREMIDEYGLEANKAYSLEEEREYSSLAAGADEVLDILEGRQ